MTWLNADAIQNRRSLLRRAGAISAAAWLAQSWALGAAPSEADRLSAIEAKGKAAGLGRFRSSRTERFLGVGDAPDSFRDAALEICEALGRLFASDLRARGFQLEYPNDRMMVVALQDSRSYEAFLGEAPAADVGGHFDLNANRLVIFDFRPGAEANSGAERINTFTLVHETIHLLSFNTGLMSLVREPPKCVIEGVATCFEMWRPRNRVGLGAINRPRLLAMRESAAPWIETAELLADDGLLDHQETAQRAYGQSWLLVHSLLKNREDRLKFRAYLEAIRASGSTGDRLKTAEQHLGPLAKLDQRLQGETAAMSRSLPPN